MDLIVETLAERCKSLHDVLRAEVRDLTPAQVNDVPAPGTNSIGVLVIHTLGSEAQAWRLVAGQQPIRDRAAEFAAKDTAPADLIARLNASDDTIDELAPLINAEALRAVWARSDGLARTGIRWLLGCLGHGHEHLGHIQLAKQLCPDRFPPPARPG